MRSQLADFNSFRHKFKKILIGIILYCIKNMKDEDVEPQNSAFLWLLAGTPRSVSRGIIWLLVTTAPAPTVVLSAS
jgi:hypothetical protein